MAGQGRLDEGKGGRARAGCWRQWLGKGRVLAAVAGQGQGQLGNGNGGYMAAQANGYAR